MLRKLGDLIRFCNFQMIQTRTENRANLISVRDTISNFYYSYKVGPSQLLLTIVVVALTSPSFIFNFLSELWWKTSFHSSEGKLESSSFRGRTAIELLKQCNCFMTSERWWFQLKKMDVKNTKNNEQSRCLFQA